MHFQNAWKPIVLLLHLNMVKFSVQMDTKTALDAHIGKSDYFGHFLVASKYGSHA